MNITEADRLARRIINTWNGGPNLTEWTDLLAELDAGTAGTAYIRLRNTHEHPPSIATFIKTYHSLRTATTDPIRQDSCPLDRCPGDGWVTVDYTHNGHTYRGVIPCGCPPGRHNETTYTNVRKET